MKASYDGDLLVLAANDDDCEPYDGVGAVSSVYVVGYGTEHEKVFLRGKRDSAIQYMKDMRLGWDTLVRVPASKICASVMEEAIIAAR